MKSIASLRLGCIPFRGQGHVLGPRVCGGHFDDENGHESIWRFTDIGFIHDHDMIMPLCRQWHVL